MVDKAKIDGVGGLTPGAVDDAIVKSAKMGSLSLSVLDNLQLNNGLTHSNFRNFKFSWRNIKIRLHSPDKKLDLPEEKV